MLVAGAALASAAGAAQGASPARGYAGPTSIDRGTPLYERAPDGMSCLTAFIFCRDAPTDINPVPRDNRVVWVADRNRSTLQLVCTKGRFSKAWYFTDVEPGWVYVGHIRNRPETNRVCLPWE
ncbi:MAG: hypothetical protein H7Y15_10400 [Pseudonocardia sp.]|nr:hypothetical protein [Pseudonocardia sp.]